MAIQDLADATIGATRTIGRYFTVVSVVPSLVFVAWVFLVSATGAWTGAPDLGRIPASIEEVGLGGAIALIGAAIVLALALHPVQFMLVQLLEGYWGASRLGRELRVRRTLVHLQRRQTPELGDGPAGGPDELLDVAESHATADQVRGVLVDVVAGETAFTLDSGYPHSLSATMPTRLGNVLRRYELHAGRGYRLPLLEYATPLFLVADPAHVAYVNDRRSDLDLAVRMTATLLAATAVTFIAFLPHGLWLGLALVPYLGAWLSYRGAVTVAADYGKALVAISDLNRFRLYEQLRLPQPKDTDVERAQNKKWGFIATGVEGVNISYADPK